MKDRIDLDDDGTPDDVFLHDVKYLHMERMDTGNVWVGIDMADGSHYRCSLYTPRNGRLLWRVEKDRGGPRCLT